MLFSVLSFQKICPSAIPAQRSPLSLLHFTRQLGPQNSVFDRLDSNSFLQHLQVSLNGCPTACSPALYNGLDKSGGMVDALDGAEYSGSLIILLNEGVSFVKRNMKTRWKKTANSRIEMPDYCERSVFEALVNALIHRDYLILGSEVHIDIYDDRLTITSPGGMADGTRIQERDIFNISSTRRNPVLADIFGRLGYMERQGSGFRKITEAYHAAHNYRDELEPKFYSDASSFQVTLYNLNYGTAINTAKVMIEDENVAITPDYLAIEVAIDGLNASQATIKKAKTVFASMGIDGIFGRSDIAAITSDSVTAAGNLITKLKKADLMGVSQSLCKPSN